MDSKRVAKLWAKWKAIAPELTIFWWDDNRKLWMGGETMCCDERDREFHHEFDLGETLDQAAAYIREHIEKAQAK